MRNNSATGLFILVKGNFHDVESDVMEVEKWCLDWSNCRSDLQEFRTLHRDLQIGMSAMRRRKDKWCVRKLSFMSRHQSVITR